MESSQRQPLDNATEALRQIFDQEYVDRDHAPKSELRSKAILPHFPAQVEASRCSALGPPGGSSDAGLVHVDTIRLFSDTYDGLSPRNRDWMSSLSNRLMLLPTRILLAVGFRS